MTGVQTCALPISDLYLPAGARLLVSPGQRMIGGETVMAELDPATVTPRMAIEF